MLSTDILSFILGIVTGILLFAIMTVSSDTTFSDGYREGQIDYANGKIKYCLTTNDNNERIWDKCEEK